MLKRFAFILFFVAAVSAPFIVFGAHKAGEAVAGISFRPLIIVAAVLVFLAHAWLLRVILRAFRSRERKR